MHKIPQGVSTKLHEGIGRSEKAVIIISKFQTQEFLVYRGQRVTMKRTDYRKALQKIKKTFESTADPIICREPSEDTKEDQSFCSCKDAQGHPKILYATRKETEAELAYLHLKNLRIYPCPSEKGWHLTKS